MSHSLRPHGLQQVRLPCPSPSPRVCSNTFPLSRWCRPTISSSVAPFCRTTRKVSQHTGWYCFADETIWYRSCHHLQTSGGGAGTRQASGSSTAAWTQLHTLHPCSVLLLAELKNIEDRKQLFCPSPVLSLEWPQSFSLGASVGYCSPECIWKTILKELRLELGYTWGQVHAPSSGSPSWKLKSHWYLG